MKNPKFQILIVATVMLFVTWYFNRRITQVEGLLYNAYLELEAERLKLNMHLINEHRIVPEQLENKGALTKYYEK